jgi:predicted DNA-binding ribbon-helix-helix protein
VAERRGASIAGLITEIDAARTGGLSSAIRLFVLADLEGRVG